MSVPRLVILFIFFNCLGQLVDTLRELQFCAEQVRFCRIVLRVRAAGSWPPAAGLGDRETRGSSHQLSGLIHGQFLFHGLQSGGVQEGGVRVEDHEGDLTG